MIGISECANSSGSSSRLWPSWMPVAIVASANSVPTARMKNSSAKRFSHSVLRPSHDWIRRIQKPESLNESNAVLPSSTEQTASSPGRTGVRSRLASGERTTRFPSSSRPHGDSWATSEEYTSNGSAFS